MGKGDRRTRRGKISSGSYGKSRLKIKSRSAKKSGKKVSAPAKKAPKKTTK